MSYETMMIYLVTVVAAVAAAASFYFAAMPLLQRKEKKERYRAVIEKKRRQLFEQAKSEKTKRKSTAKEEVSAAKSIAAIYRMQKLAGEAFVNARLALHQAGYRHPMGPMIYLGARGIMPILFSLVSMLFLANMEEELEPVMQMLVILTAAVCGFYLPRILVKNTADKRIQTIQENFPDALDMMLICVQGGIGIEAAINRIADTIAEHSETLAEELGILSAELGMLNDRKMAFQGFANRVGSSAARSFATAMLQAEQYGTSVSKAIRVLADESRDARMGEAERKAAALPPKLTVPMILFFLPALFITILGPAFIGSQ